MKRLLTNAVIFAGGLMVSSQLLALGLGELKLESALSQPLKAEIELVDTKGLTEWEIKPRLASQEDFDRAGVDRVFFLTKIDFKIEDGRILLSTRESINEPFLNFLIELSWPSGRVLREYTVLLDPPTYQEQNYQPLVVTPEVQATETKLVVATPEEPVLVNKWDEPAETGTYKVQPNDTLWAIALESRPSNGISPQQMMLAIQEENPQAFINGNINRLKSHHVLRIPDEQQVRSIGVAAAIAEVNRQNKALTSTTAQYDATGRAGAMSGEQSDKSGGEVRLLAAKTEEAKAAGTTGDVSQGTDASRQALENDLAIALENVDSSKRENKELNERLASLEDQIETLQRLISLKDDQLAGLQVDGAIAADAADKQIEVVEGEEAVTETHTTAAEADEVIQDYNFDDQTETVVEDSETADAEELAAQEEVAAAAEQERLEQERLEKERLEKEAFLAKQAQLKNKTIVEKLTENPLIPAGAAALLLLIVLIVARVLKKSKPEAEVADDEVGDDTMFTDFALNEGSLDDFDFSEEDETDEQAATEDESEERAPTAQDSIASLDGEAQTEDVITESDIYIAFGNFERATQILKDAIAKEPKRSDLKLKLLEVYTETDDAEEFAVTEAQLLTLNDAEASAEAESMRKRLSLPIEPVAIQTEPEQDLASTAAEELDIDLSADFDEGLNFEDALDRDAADESDSDSALDFDSQAEDIPTLDLDESAAETEKPTQHSNDLEFSFDEKEELNVPELDIESMQADAEDESVKAEDNSLDFSMDFESETTSSETTAVTEVDENLETLDFDSSSKDSNRVETLEFDVSYQDESDSFDSLEDILDSKESSTDEPTDYSFDLENVEAGDSDSLELDEGEFDISELDSELDAPELDAPTLDELSLDSELPDFSDDELDFDLGASSPTTPQAEVSTPIEETEPAQPVVAPVTKPQTASTGEIDLDELAASENEFDFLAGTDESATKLDLARAYIDMEDTVGAKELLQEVVEEGTDQQKTEARELLANLA